MLWNLKVKNFGPFKEEFEFSMKPGRSSSRFEDNIINLNNAKASKISVIVGENAGGKTSVMRSLDYFIYLIKENKAHGSLPEFCYINDGNCHQEFEIEAIVEGKIYRYKLIQERQGILYESLSYRKTLSDREYINIFEFSVNKIDIDKETLRGVMYVKHESVYTKMFDKIYLKNIQNSLIINVLDTLGYDIVQPFVNWVKNKVIIKILDKISLNTYINLEKTQEDLKILKQKTFLDIFSLVDSTIVGIKIDEKDIFRDTEIIRRRREDESKFNIKLKDDSNGVKEHFAWSIELWKVVNQGATLFADELDRCFNSILANKVLNYVKANSDMGQFVFTTHNVMHINTVDFMKEQIYFVHKDEDSLESTLYSLSEFKDYSYDKSDVYKLYLKGLLGGVPNG